MIRPNLFSLIRYVNVTETIHSIPVLFLDFKDETANPNIVYEKNFLLCDLLQFKAAHLLIMIQRADWITELSS